MNWLLCLIVILAYLHAYDNGDENTNLTPGGGAHLWGQRLNFDQTDPEQGIFFVPSSGNGDQVPLTRAEVVMRNSSRELIFLVPSDLPAGDYRLEVHSLFGQEVRSGRLNKMLTVA